MAKVKEGETVYTRGRTYKAGDDAPDELFKEPPKIDPKKDPKKEPKKDK